MTRWTPGPWEEGFKDAGNWYGVYSGNTRVAHMLSTVGEFNQEKANAKLIANAPTMAEALKEIANMPPCDSSTREFVKEIAQKALEGIDD